MQTSLFGVGATELRVLALVTGVLVASAAVSCYLPARRAFRIDPAVALRCD